MAWDLEAGAKWLCWCMLFGKQDHRSGGEGSYLNHWRADVNINPFAPFAGLNEMRAFVLGDLGVVRAGGFMCWYLTSRLASTKGRTRRAGSSSGIHGVLRPGCLARHAACHILRGGLFAAASSHVISDPAIGIVPGSSLDVFSHVFSVPSTVPEGSCVVEIRMLCRLSQTLRKSTLPRIRRLPAI